MILGPLTLTWDTLKRMRRQKRKTEGINIPNIIDNSKEAIVYQSKDDKCYKSSPNLLSFNLDNNSTNKSILKYTSKYFNVVFRCSLLCLFSFQTGRDLSRLLHLTS